MLISICLMSKLQWCPEKNLLWILWSSCQHTSSKYKKKEMIHTPQLRSLLQNNCLIFWKIVNVSKDKEDWRIEETSWSKTRQTNTHKLCLIQYPGLQLPTRKSKKQVTHENVFIPSKHREVLRRKAEIQLQIPFDGKMKVNGRANVAKY